jgi:hypothetical protein
VQRGLGGAERAVRHRGKRRPRPRRHRRERLQGTDLGHHQRLVALHVGVPTGASEPRDRGVHEARVARPQRVVAQAEALGDSGAERLHDDVGRGGEVLGSTTVLGILQVDLDALLAARPERVRGLRPQLAPARRLDLHYLGPEVGEELRRLGARQRVREVDDPQPRERGHAGLAAAGVVLKTPFRFRLGSC